MLYVPRKKVIQRYADTIKGLDGNISNSEEYFLNGKLTILKNLFGTKCLPNEEPKPAEPKFKVGEKVMYKGVLRVIDLIDTVTHRYHLSNGNYYAEWVYESDLEPYTKPEEPTCTRTCTDDCPSQSRNLSQETANCDKCNDRRLHIAAMAMQGIMSASDPLMFSEKGCLSAEAIARQALKYADALIAEAEKGGAVGNS